MTHWHARSETADGEVLVTAESLRWIRWRLAAELHARAYHEIGVEVTPGPRGEGLDRYRVSTPHCRQGSRQLAVLAADGRWLGGATERPAPSWPAFRRRAFAELGVPHWPRRRHLGCFHRRGKARHDLIFEVAVTLVAGAPAAAGTEFWSLDADDPDRGSFEAMLAAAGTEIPAGKPPRHLAVACCGTALAALRSDGYAVTSGGPVDLAALWWSGADVTALSDSLCDSAGHRHRGLHR